MLSPSIGLLKAPSKDSPALFEIINRSLVSIQSSRKLNDLDPRPGVEKEFEIAPGVKIVMCWIPPGEFWMGSPGDEVGRSKNEAQHLVRITQGFWLAKTQITQVQWQAVMEQNPSLFKGANLPVERVSWNDICGDQTSTGGFLGAINRIFRSDGRFHLPSEVQWEYACRGGTTGPYYGNLDEIAWHSDNSGYRTHPVGLKKANAWSLCDMLGNVLEWCADWYGDYQTAAADDPKGVDSGTNRILRGGGWGSSASSSRVATRSHSRPVGTNGDIGFRIAFSSVLTMPNSENLANHVEDPVTKSVQNQIDKTLEVSKPPPNVEGKFETTAKIRKDEIENPPTDLTQFQSNKIISGSQRRAGEVRMFEIVRGVQIVMCWIPPGTFTMGSSEADRFGKDDSVARNDENEVKVTLTKGFWLAKTETTQAQWEAVMGYNPSHFNGKNLPVESISWEEVQEFIKNVNASGILPEEWTMALPTEAQWEYACRAGETGAYYGGIIDEVAWYGANCNETTHPVATKKPNAWGLHDMHGNVGEWCADCYSVKIKGRPCEHQIMRLKGGIDPIGYQPRSLQGESGYHYVERGGSIFSDSTYTRILEAKIHSNSSGAGFINLGFRLALVLLPPSLGSATEPAQND